MLLLLLLLSILELVFVSSLYEWFSIAVKSMSYGQILIVRPDLSYLDQPQFPYHSQNYMSLVQRTQLRG